MYKYIIYLFLIFLFYISNSLTYSQSLFYYYRDYQHQNYKLADKHTDTDSISVYKILEDKKEELISGAYISAGYDSIKLTDSVYRAYLTRGHKYFWDNLEPDTSFTDIFQKAKINNKPVDIYRLNKMYENILKYCQNNGYPFARIELDEFYINDSLFKAKINVDKGDKYYFDSIIIKGDIDLKYHYLQNYLSLRKGSIFSMRKTDEINRLIGNLAFIEQTRNYELAFIDNKADLVMYLKSKKANQFNGILGILPNNQTTDKILITGDVNLLLNNALGRGELLSFEWQRLEEQSQNLLINGFYPYWFRSRFGTGIEFNMEKRDSSYFSTDLKISLRYFTFADNGFDIFYQSFNSYVLDNKQPDSDYANIKADLGGLSYKYAKLDNVFNPRRGLSFYISSAMGTRTSSLSSEDNEEKSVLHSRSTLILSYYLPIFKYMAIKFNNRTSLMYSEQLYENELFRIGGLNTIRGFDEYSLPTSGYSIYNIEIRYLFEENSAFFGFYDFAYFEKRFTKEEGYNLAHGIGAGINLQTNAGVFSLVYALGKINQNNFDFNSFKIHIGYRNNF